MTIEPFKAFADRCHKSGLTLPSMDRTALATVNCIRVSYTDWFEMIELAHDTGFRFCAFWAQEQNDNLETLICLELEGEYLVLRTEVKFDKTLASISSIYPAADRPERHASDLLGLKFHGQNDSRRWVRHQAWSQDEYPLLTSFPLKPDHNTSTPADDAYPFLTIQGAGVIEIPVGPVHAGIIEPGHFRFQAVGETILNLEERLGYVHKGIEKLAVGRDVHGLARLAGRISGDTTVAHCWAACQALERAANVDVPVRALHIRAIMAERERIANHMGDIGAICNDVGFAFAQYQFTRLKEDWVRLNQRLFNHRFMMDKIIPGGVAVNLDDQGIELLRQQVVTMMPEIRAIVERLEGSESLEDRLMTTGRLTPEQASENSVVGYMGKASGQSFDVRHAAPYPPYDQLSVTIPVYRAGDVAARARVRTDEIDISLNLILSLLDSLPDSSICAEWNNEINNVEGLGFIEGWRGEILTYVRLDEKGKIQRFFPRDPSWLMWPSLEILINGNIVPDFPVCNKSVNGSYSGQDL